MRTEVIQAAGLTEGESKVYLALLELGTSTTGPIIDKAGVARSFVPHILESLIQKGLVSYITKQKTRQYQAAQPARLLDYIDERAQQVLESKKTIEHILPQLALLQQQSQRSAVNVFEGFKGLVTAHEHVYDKVCRGEEYVYMGITADVPSFNHAYWHKDHLRRAKAGIKCRLLFHEGTELEQLRWRNAIAGCDARYMRKGVFTPAWFLIYKDTVLISLEQEPIAIEIVNAKIADSFRAHFEEAWKDTKAFPQRRGQAQKKHVPRE